MNENLNSSSLSCPKCQSYNIKKRRGWNTVIFWTVIFLAAVILSIFSGKWNDLIYVGASSVAVILIISILIIVLQTLQVQIDVKIADMLGDNNNKI